MNLAGPPAEIAFRKPFRIGAALGELWSRRELILTLTERELRARYKQTRLGFAWSVIMPILLMIVFSMFINRVVDIDTGGVPYPVYAYLGLIPWFFFSVSVNQGGQSLLNDASLLNKVYCPREVFPISRVAVSGVDALISTVILTILFAIYGLLPHAEIYWLPVLLFVQVAFTTGVTLLVSALVVYVRDLRQALPLLLQLGLFATPVAYPIRLSEQWERIYAALNPLLPVINGYRRTILFGLAPEKDLLVIGGISSIVVLLAGYLIFKKLEKGFADVA